MKSNFHSLTLCEVAVAFGNGISMFQIISEIQKSHWYCSLKRIALIHLRNLTWRSIRMAKTRKKNNLTQNYQPQTKIIQPEFQNLSKQLDICASAMAPKKNVAFRHDQRFYLLSETVTCLLAFWFFFPTLTPESWLPLITEVIHLKPSSADVDNLHFLRILIVSIEFFIQWKTSKPEWKNKHPKSHNIG